MQGAARRRGNFKNPLTKDRSDFRLIFSLLTKKAFGGNSWIRTDRRYGLASNYFGSTSGLSKGENKLADQQYHNLVTNRGRGT
jgi:hypothetical protein